MTTLPLGASFIIAIVAIAVLAVLIGTVYFANWQQDQDFTKWRREEASRAGRAANAGLVTHGEPPAELDEPSQAS